MTALKEGIVYKYHDVEFILSPLDQKYYVVNQRKYTGQEMDISGITALSLVSEVIHLGRNIEWKDLSPDLYSISRQSFTFPLIPDSERSRLDVIIANIAGFQNIIKTAVAYRESSYSNCILISGAPGTGKTHNTMTWLEELVDADVIQGFNKISGKITPLSLFKYLEENKAEEVQVMDDCDVFLNVESLNLLKSALDTRTDTPDNREVTYGSKGAIQRAKYNSFMIMITNETFEKPNPHVSALLDRVHLVELPFTAQDMHLFTLHLIEEMFESDPKVKQETKEKVRDLLLGELQEFVDYDLFNITRINFSIRFVTKIVDLVGMFGDNWKFNSRDYKRLSQALTVAKTAGLQKTTKK